MEKYLLPATSPSQSKKSIPQRAQWRRSLIELTGKFDSSYRHHLYSLSMQSYSQVGAFPHAYHIDGVPCETHVDRFANVDNPRRKKIQGVSALEFDSKGIYLASVTKSGCLTVHDFDELYCQVNVKHPVVKEDETKQVLHIPICQPLDVVRWNIANQYEVACTSRKSGEVHIYDLGYVSSEPVEVLRKKPGFSIYGSEVQKGLSDIAFSSNDRSRVLASDLLGVINIWDRRTSNLPCHYLRTFTCNAINSIKFNVDNQIIFGAGKHGIIYTWDLRGGSSSSAFENVTMGHYPPLLSVNLAYELKKIGDLEAQSKIIANEILSIDLNPSCPYQLAFHLDNGWSGVYDVQNFQVTHVHCPPPLWLDGFNDFAYLSYLRRSSWLPVYSIYAVGSPKRGLHLLDFYHDHTSPCYVDYDEDLQDMATVNGQKKQNRYIPLSEAITACTAHPFYGAIIAGTEESSLLLLSQEFMPSLETNDSPI